MSRKRVILLGSTGSIGESTCAVVDNLPEELSLVALAAHRRWEPLLRQIRRYRPESVALTDEAAADRLEEGMIDEAISPRPRVYRGASGLSDMVRETDAEVVVAAISGAVGLPANLAAIESGKDLALANKESLVMSGSILMDRARRAGRTVLPVDSEHSAIFQSLLSGRADEVESIILTASGGPFRTATLDEIKNATKEQALRHPTWSMGDKITIDSATLMNKALEVIEARWLFDMEPDRIRVVIHPQSMIHSLVEFHDGSLVCQLGPPDMKIPIQYALTYPRRRPLPIERLDLAKIGTFTFFQPDTERFPALRIAYDVLVAGGTAPAVFNAANEVAVRAFLDDQIPFHEILGTVERTVDAHRPDQAPDLEAILAADRWAREEASAQMQNHRTQAR